MSITECGALGLGVLFAAATSVVGCAIGAFIPATSVSTLRAGDVITFSVAATMTPILNAAAASMVGVALLAGAAWGAAVPDSTRRAGLQEQFAAAPFVRITSLRGVYESRQPVVEPGGILLRSRDTRPALVVTGDVRPEERRIAWRDVERIDTVRSNAVRGLAWGAAVGAAITAFAIAGNGGSIDAFERGDSGLLALGMVFTAATGVTGLTIGALLPHRERLYP